MYTKKQLEEIISNALSYGLTDVVISSMKTSYKIFILKAENKLLPYKGSDWGTYIRFKQEDQYKVISFSKKITVSEIKQELEKYKIQDKKIKFSFKYFDKDSNLSKNNKETKIINMLKKHHKDLMKLKKDCNNQASQWQNSFTYKQIARSDRKSLVEMEYEVNQIYWYFDVFNDKEKYSRDVRFKKQMNSSDFLDFISKYNITNMIKDEYEIGQKLLIAERIKNGKYPLVLANGFGAVLFHEACGHQLEAKFVTSNISQYGDKKEQKVASELVTLLDNGLDKNAIGYAKYDDEGNKQSKRLLIKKGVLKNFLIDDLDSHKLNTKSNGSGRTQSYNLDPVSRMTNTYIENGKSTFDEIIGSIKYGIYAKSLSGGQVNPVSGQFNFGISEAYIIKDGKIDSLVKPVAIIGNGLEVIKRISMVGNDFEWSDFGVCGSSSGKINVGVGQPSVKIDEITISST